MAGKQDRDDSIGGLTKSFLRPYVSVGLAFALPYVITCVLFAAFIAYVFPKAFVIVATILVVIFVMITWKLLRTKRRVQHSLMARRADKQNAAYLRGKERGLYGKYDPERLD
jgi:hypothetical protein